MVLITLHTHDKEPIYMNLNAINFIIPLTATDDECKAAISWGAESVTVCEVIESCDEILSKITEAKHQMINSHSGEGVWIIS